jgi:hypothetical protein
MVDRRRRLLIIGMIAAAVMVGGREADAAKKASGVIPKDVTYKVIEEQTIPGAKRSLDVRLNKKVSREVLRAIALTLKQRDPRKYDRTFIVYLLPGMKPGAGAWATSHFDPELELQILGSTAEEEAEMKKSSIEPGAKVIGRWTDDQAVGALLTIYKKGRKLILRYTFKDGSELTKEIREGRSSKGRRFEPKQKSGDGAHWIIDKKGNLQLRDAYGLVATAQKVD